MEKIECHCSRADTDKPAPEFTLAPLMRDGRNSLACGDIEGVRSIRLTSITECYDGEPWQRITRQSTDCFKLLEHELFIWPPFPEQLQAAEFLVCLQDGRRLPVKVKTTRLTARDQAEIVWDKQNEWLEKRGFLIRRTDGSIPVAQP